MYDVVVSINIDGQIILNLTNNLISFLFKKKSFLCKKYMGNSYTIKLPISCNTNII